MKTEWTREEWEQSRWERRRISNLISPLPCGRTDSKMDIAYRAANGGKRNLPFATDEQLQALAKPPKET